MTPPPKRNIRRDNDASNKRARNEETTTAEEEEAAIIVYTWLDRGEIDSNGLHQHQGIQLQQEGGDAREFAIRVGDAVVLYNGDVTKANQWICRVQSLWESKNGMFFSGVWMYSKGDLSGFRGTWRGILRQSEMLGQMDADKELVMSDKADVNEIACIQRKLKVVYLKPEQHVPKDLADDAFVCRYQLSTSPNMWRLSEWVEWGDKEGGAVEANDSLSSSSDESDHEEDQVIGEGSQLRGYDFLCSLSFLEQDTKRQLTHVCSNLLHSSVTSKSALNIKSLSSLLFLALKSHPVIQRSFGKRTQLRTKILALS
jgi:hypothetical protein